jgi:hypothetical protein
MAHTAAAKARRRPCCATNVLATGRPEAVARGEWVEAEVVEEATRMT